VGARAGGRGACRRPEPERLFSSGPRLARARVFEGELDGAGSGAASRPARPRRGAEDDTSAGGLAALVPAAAGGQVGGGGLWSARRVRLARAATWYGTLVFQLMMRRR